MQSVKRAVGNSLFRAKDAIGRFRLERLANCPANPAAVLMYHGLETDPVRLQCNPLDVRPHAFLAEIRFFQRQGYSLVTPDQLSTTLARGTDRASLLVSFDDGNRNAFGTLKDLMQRDQITTMVAVCPQVIESEEVYWWEELLARVAGADNSVQVDLDGDRQVVRKTQGESLVQRCKQVTVSTLESVMTQLRDQTPHLNEQHIWESPFVHRNMTWNELGQLVDTGRCVVAAHSMRHYAATKMPPKQFEDDAVNCREQIRSRLGVDCVDFVYPFGSPEDFSPETDHSLRRCGYRRSYTTVSRLNLGKETFGLGRFRGDGLCGSLNYYAYLWRHRHQEPANV